MDSPAPLIYARCNDHEATTPWLRVGGLAVALGCLTLLIVAASLPPNPNGLATHTRLGMQECQFLVRTGLPCPSCGMTTSFAWFVRGNLLASFYVQPMGAMLALICCCCVWVGLYIAITGRPVHRLLRVIPSRYILWPLFSLAICAWAWKIFLHLSGHDGW